MNRKRKPNSSDIAIPPVASARGPRGAPGKRPRTPRAAAPPVQRAAANSTAARSQADPWADVAIRPDLHAAPVQMLRDRSGAEVEQASAEQVQEAEAQIEEAFANASPEQLAVFELVMLKVKHTYGDGALLQLLGGAMFTFDDGGALYHSLVAASGGQSYTRLSKSKQTSHYAEGAGYDIRSAIVNEDTGLNCQQGFDFPKGTLLFGIVPPKTDGSEAGGASFFQTEGAGLTLTSLPAHTLHFLQHVILHINTGMMGQSPHSEKFGREIRDVDNREDIVANMV